MSDGGAAVASGGGAAPSNGASSSTPSSGGSSSGDSSSLGTASGTQQTGSSEQAAAKAAKYVPNERGKYVIKVHGRDQEVGLDEALQNYQQKRASQAAMEEATRIRKQTEGLIRNLQEGAQKKDFARARAFLAKLGYDTRGMAEWELGEALRQEQMSPQDRARAELAQREKALQSREEKWQKEQHEKQVAEYEKHYADEAAREAPKALKAVGVPQTAYQLRRLGTLMSESIDSDHPLSYEDAAAIVAEEYNEETGAHIGALGVDELLKLIGEDRMKEIRKRDIERVRNPGAPPSPSDLTPAARGAAKPKAAPVSTEEYFRRLRRGM